MSTQPRHYLTIVQESQPAARSASAKPSSSTSAGKKAANTRKTSARKPKVKLIARRAKTTAATETSTRRRRQAKLQIAPVPVPLSEMEATPLPVEQAEATATHAVAEAFPSAPIVFPIEAAVADEFPAENIEIDTEPASDFPALEDVCAEMEVIAEPQFAFVPEPAPSTETPLPDAFLAEPENFRRTFAFQWSAFLQVLTRGWIWLQQRLKTQQAKKRLRVCETVSLGEKRFIAVVQVDGEQFLVGGSSTSVSTLAHLEQPREFSDVFRRFEQGGMQA